MTLPTRPIRAPVEPHPPPPWLLRAGNPVVRTLLRSPLHHLLGGKFLLLSFTGRKSGRSFIIPAACHWVDGAPVIVTSAGWRHNFRGGAPLEVVLEGRRMAATADLIEDADDVARVHRVLLERPGRLEAWLLGLKVDRARMPDHAELKSATSGRALVRIHLER